MLGGCRGQVKEEPVCPMKHVLPFAISSAIVTAAPGALAFGGTAGELGQQGNFVVSNRANLGFSQSLGSPSTTSIALAPELDYFVAPNFSVGGAVLFGFTTTSGRPDHATSFGVVPQIGYHVVLSDTWSFWPRLAVTLVTGTPGHISVEASAPFLIHPTQHFFFGFGPAIASDLTGPDRFSAILGEFMIGGYFNS
jgi:hypothetical protein